jgi:uncharacterized protein (DUF1330 family)
MAGMWVVQVDVKDDDRYAEYIKGSSRVVAAHDGEFIARGGRYQQKEGEEYTRNVLVRFPTYEKAVAAYESDEYQAIVGIAKDSAERRLTILETDD